MNATSPKAEIRTKQVQLRLTPSEYAILATKAKQAGCKVSQLIRFANFNSINAAQK